MGFCWDICELDRWGEHSITVPDEVNSFWRAVWARGRRTGSRFHTTCQPMAKPVWPFRVSSALWWKPDHGMRFSLLMRTTLWDGHKVCTELCKRPFFPTLHWFIGSFVRLFQDSTTGFSCNLMLFFGIYAKNCDDTPWDGLCHSTYANCQNTVPLWNGGV